MTGGGEVVRPLEITKLLLFFASSNVKMFVIRLGFPNISLALLARQGSNVPRSPGPREALAERL